MRSTFRAEFRECCVIPAAVAVGNIRAMLNFLLFVMLFGSSIANVNDRRMYESFAKRESRLLLAFAHSTFIIQVAQQAHLSTFFAMYVSNQSSLAHVSPSSL